MSTEEISVVSSPETDRIEDYLSTLEERISEGRFYKKLGADTDFIKSVKFAIENPQKAIDTVTQLLGKAFVLIFWDQLKKKKYIDFVSDIGMYAIGSKIRIWVYLKSEYYNFETRAKFYSLKAKLANNDAFSNIEVDLMMLVEGEVLLPENYLSLTSAEDA